MSFQNNSIWFASGSGSLVNGEICYDTSTRIDKKRGHQWFMDTSEQELFFNKKQAIESVEETSGTAVMDGSLWLGGFNSQSGDQAGDHLLNTSTGQSANVSDKNIPSIISTAVNTEKKGFDNQFGNDSSICLTMSQMVEAPLCLNTGLRKVKVNEVRISDNCLPAFAGNAFCPGEKDKVISTTFQRTDNNLFPGPTYSTAGENTISLDPASSKIDKKFVSVGQASDKIEANFMLSNQYYNDNNVLSIGQSFNRGNYNIHTAGEQYGKEFISVGPNYSKGHENFFAVDPFYNKVNEVFMPVDSTYNKGATNFVIHCQQDAAVGSLGALYNKENSSIVSMVENSKKGEQTISFGGFQDNHEESDQSGRLISSYDVLLNQSSAQSSAPLGHKDSTEQLTVISAATSRTDGAHKSKDQKTKKGSSNNFPSNVKSLLSTGILDGVPVKYVSWSREKNLRGVVKGTGYLCSCQDCKLSKAINAYEFERHAGCKTKHPNNHIYFENGKTIYAVVQELKSTPQDMLFDAIQNATGSAVNQKNFYTWKASYQAATRELQRIYGKDEMIVPSS